jgi:tripartite-type tricarboxylate transporter receptor subunit TctC
MKLSRLCAGVLLALAAAMAQAQAWPTKPVKIIVPYGAGFAPDAFARIVGEALSPRLKQPIVVENYQGAGGKIGLEAFAKAPADGYTLFLGSMDTQSILQHLYQLSLDPARDVAPISVVAWLNNMITVTNGLPVKDFRELIARAKANPGKVTYASPGVGTNLHLIGEMINQRLGVTLLHVPYRQLGSLVTDITSGNVDTAITGVPPLMAHVKSGKIRALATTGARRDSHLPDVPTLAESGYPDIVFSTWFGLLAPKDTPPAIVDRLYREVAAIVQEPAYRQRILGMGAEPDSLAPKPFAALILKDAERWGRVVREGKIKID